MGTGKIGNDEPKSSRKRRLTVVYFVDSARTRSFSMPLGRLNILLVAFGMLLAWSVVSAIALVNLGKDRWQAAERMRTALATIFDYETKYDHVYDIAYPQGSKTAKPHVAAAAPDPKAEPKVEPKPDLIPAPPPVTAPAAATADAKAAEALPEKPSAAEAVVAQSPSPIIVSNPVVSAGAAALEVHFDLTNKAAERADGFIWAVAEFKADGTGTTQFIVAPQGLLLGANGEPTEPQRSAVFGIKHFKKKNFSFPVAKGTTGTFVGVKIGILDKTGQKRTTYNVPVDIRVGGETAKTKSKSH